MITIEQLNIAIAWLEANEGDDGESEACQAVADRLKKEIEDRIIDQNLRRVSKEHNIPFKLLKERYKKLHPTK